MKTNRKNTSMTQQSMEALILQVWKPVIATSIPQIRRQEVKIVKATCGSSMEMRNGRPLFENLKENQTKKKNIEFQSPVFEDEK